MKVNWACRYILVIKDVPNMTDTALVDEATLMLCSGEIFIL